MAHGSQQSAFLLFWCHRAIRARILSIVLTRAHGSQQDAAGAAQPPQSPPATQADVMRMRAAVTVKHLRRNGKSEPSAATVARLASTALPNSSDEFLGRRRMGGGETAGSEVSDEIGFRRNEA